MIDFFLNNIFLDIVGLVIGAVLVFCYHKKLVNKVVGLVGYCMLGWFGMGIILNLLNV
jgi:hypothetical protein